MDKWGIPRDRISDLASQHRDTSDTGPVPGCTLSLLGPPGCLINVLSLAVHGAKIKGRSGGLGRRCQEGGGGESSIEQGGGCADGGRRRAGDRCRQGRLAKSHGCCEEALTNVQGSGSNPAGLESEAILTFRVPTPFRRRPSRDGRNRS